MVKTRADFADFASPDTIIGDGVSVEGTLKTAGDIQINGRFKGVLITNGDVVVGERARVKANLNAQNVYVAGEVVGDVNAIGKLEIMETGCIEGDVSTSALSIEAGGILKGSSTMHDTERVKPDITPTYEVEDSGAVLEEETA